MPKTHGKYGTATHQAWASMRKRCSNPNNPHYMDYGGRGIAVCEQWQRFEGFYADMGDCPAGMSLDRIDNEGDYCPENCRWATARTQGNNRRNNTLLELDGKRMSISQWANETGINRYTISDRVTRLGWSAQRALTEPVKQRRQV